MSSVEAHFVASFIASWYFTLFSYGFFFVNRFSFSRSLCFVLCFFKRMWYTPMSIILSFRCFFAVFWRDSLSQLSQPTTEPDKKRTFSYKMSEVFIFCENIIPCSVIIKKRRWTHTKKCWPFVKLKMLLRDGGGRWIKEKANKSHFSIVLFVLFLLVSGSFCHWAFSFASQNVRSSHTLTHKRHINIRCCDSEIRKKWPERRRRRNREEKKTHTHCALISWVHNIYFIALVKFWQFFLLIGLIVLNNSCHF